MNATEFKAKYLPYHPKMYRVAFRLLENTFDAEDMVQEAFVKLWNKRDELAHVENSESYCIVILRNLCLDFLRSKNKYQMESTENIVVQAERNLTDEIENADNIKHLEAIIAQLPEQQQKIIKLRHFDDYSNEEIEKIMGLTGANTRVLLSRARKKIKELFYMQYNYGNS